MMEDIQITQWDQLGMEHLNELMEIALRENQNGLFRYTCFMTDIIGGKGFSDTKCGGCPLGILRASGEHESQTLCFYILDNRINEGEVQITPGDIIELIEYEKEKRSEHMLNKHYKDMEEFIRKIQTEQLNNYIGSGREVWKTYR